MTAGHKNDYVPPFAHTMTMTYVQLDGSELQVVVFSLSLDVTDPLTVHLRTEAFSPLPLFPLLRQKMPTRCKDAPPPGHGVTCEDVFFEALVAADLVVEALMRSYTPLLRSVAEHMHTNYTQTQHSPHFEESTHGMAMPYTEAVNVALGFALLEVVVPMSTDTKHVQGEMSEAQITCLFDDTVGLTESRLSLSGVSARARLIRRWIKMVRRGVDNEMKTW